MSDEKLNKEETAEAVEGGEADEQKEPSKKRSGKKWAIVGVVVVALVAVGVGMMVWHESPTFCSTLCHIEQPYVDNYMQEQGVVGTDKFGNEVSNTNAMMAVLHRETPATAKPEIVCVDCHVPNMAELAHDGVNFVSGNYPMPRDERSVSHLMSWDGKEGSSFCANENCHVYLLGNDGKVDMTKLAQVTADGEFNPHAQHHPNLTLECSDCHKGHRASTIVCTGCHEHENVALPDGWVTYDESQRLLQDGYSGNAA